MEDFRRSQLDEDVMPANGNWRAEMDAEEEDQLAIQRAYLTAFQALRQCLPVARHRTSRLRRGTLPNSHSPSPSRTDIKFKQSTEQHKLMTAMML